MERSAPRAGAESYSLRRTFSSEGMEGFNDILSKLSGCHEMFGLGGVFEREKKPEPLCLEIRWRFTMVGGSRGRGGSFAGDTVPPLLFLAADTRQLELELKSQSPSLAGSSDSLTGSIFFFPQGILFAHDVTWAVTWVFFFGRGTGWCHQKQAGGRRAEGRRGVAVRRERGGFGIGMI